MTIVIVNIQSEIEFIKNSKPYADIDTSEYINTELVRSVSKDVLIDDWLSTVFINITNDRDQYIMNIKDIANKLNHKNDIRIDINEEMSCIIQLIDSVTIKMNNLKLLKSNYLYFVLGTNYRDTVSLNVIG